MYPLMLFIHVAAVVVWIGGMFFAVFCLRPAVSALPPAERIGVMKAALDRFLQAVSLAILAVLGSGLAMLLPVGFRYAPMSWHVMGGMGLLMTALYAHILFAPYRRLQRAAAAQDWTGAAAALDQIRTWVTINMILGVGTIAVATIGRLMT